MACEISLQFGARPAEQLLSFEVAAFLPCVGRCRRPLASESCSEGRRHGCVPAVAIKRLRIALENDMFDIGRPPKYERLRRTPPSRDGPPFKTPPSRAPPL